MKSSVFGVSFKIFLIVLTSFFTQSSLSAQGLTFEGMIKMEIPSETPKQKATVIKVFCHDGKICIDSLDAGGTQLKVIADLKSQKMYFIPGQAPMALTATFAELTEQMKSASIPIKAIDTAVFAEGTVSINNTTENKLIRGYSCKKYLLKGKENLSTVETQGGEFWMTADAGISLADLKPLVDILNGMPSVRPITAMCKNIPVDFLTSFPLELHINPDLETKSKKDDFRIKFTFYKGQNGAEKFDMKDLAMTPFSEFVKSQKKGDK